MKRSAPGKPPPKGAGPDGADGRKARPARQNPKLADQTRKKLGKHYASKYQTGRRG